MYLPGGTQDVHILCTVRSELTDAWVRGYIRYYNETLLGLRLAHNKDGERCELSMSHTARLMFAYVNIVRG